MPGPAHEVLLAALREEPALLGQLLRKLTGKRLPGPVVPVDSNVRFARPAEVRPDLVFRGRRRRWILVELQHRVDRTKRRRWLLAASALFDQEGTMGEVVVLTARRSVAAWVRRAAHVRGELGTRLALTPLVLLVVGEGIEALLDPAHPELALFAAWAVHARRGARAQAIVERALEVTDALPSALRGAQARAILSVLGEPLLANLRKMALDPSKIRMSRSAARLVHLLEERGREMARAEGRTEGKAEGRTEGKAEGQQKALLDVLAVRGFAVPADVRARVLDCKDAAQLERWIAKAVTAGSVAEVFGPARPRRARAAKTTAARPRAASSKPAAPRTRKGAASRA